MAMSNLDRLSREEETAAQKAAAKQEAKRRKRLKDKAKAQQGKHAAAADPNAAVEPSHGPSNLLPAAVMGSSTELDVPAMQGASALANQQQPSACPFQVCSGQTALARQKPQLPAVQTSDSSSAKKSMQSGAETNASKAAPDGSIRPAGTQQPQAAALSNLDMDALEASRQKVESTAAAGADRGHAAVGAPKNLSAMPQPGQKIKQQAAAGTDREHAAVGTPKNLSAMPRPGQTIKQQAAAGTDREYAVIGPSDNLSSIPQSGQNIKPQKAAQQAVPGPRTGHASPQQASKHQSSTGRQVANVPNILRATSSVSSWAERPPQLSDVSNLQAWLKPNASDRFAGMDASGTDIPLRTSVTPDVSLSASEQEHEPQAGAASTTAALMAAAAGAFSKLPWPSLNAIPASLSLFLCDATRIACSPDVRLP